MTVTTVNQMTGEEERAIEDSGCLLADNPKDRYGWQHVWIRLPACKQGNWAVGPLDSWTHAVVETPAAVWIASYGELIRLDRNCSRNGLPTTTSAVVRECREETKWAKTENERGSRALVR